MQFPLAKQLFCSANNSSCSALLAAHSGYPAEFRLSALLLRHLRPPPRFFNSLHWLTAPSPVQAVSTEQDPLRPEAPCPSSAKRPHATPSPWKARRRTTSLATWWGKGARLSFVHGERHGLICLPQAFGDVSQAPGRGSASHWLKRLDITPVVCNVGKSGCCGEWGYQPGVNRCKLISRQDFRQLYNDCTSASSRPGRPPKRLQSVTEGGTHHMLSHSGLMHAGIMPPADLSALAKKIKLEAMASYHSNQQHGGPNGENGDHNPGLVLDQLPFMMMSHPLIPASLAPASVSMAMGQMNRLSTLASMANVAQLHANPPARAPTSVIKERVRDSPSPSPSLEEAQMSSNHSSSVSSSPSHTERTAETAHSLHDGLSSSHSVLGHSPGVVQGSRETDVTPVEYSKESKRSHTDRAGSAEGYHKRPSRRSRTSWK
ncbi:dachshund c isoform X1, partial [Lates japonicus]